MKDSQLRKLVRQEITKRLDKLQTEEKDPLVPTYGKGDVVHDCPKHVQETKTGLYGKVTGHTLNEAGAVNFVDVDFGTGKVFKNIPTKKLKVLEMHQHVHETNPEPITGAGEDEVVSEDGIRCECGTEHPGISHRAYVSQQLAEGRFDKAKLIQALGSNHNGYIIVKGKKYIIYNPDSGNRDNTKMWKPNTIKALVPNVGDEKEFRYSDIQGFTLNEDLKIKPKMMNQMGSSLGYRLTQPQHKKMLALLKKNSSNPHVKKLLSTLKDKYSDAVTISLDNRPFFVYASYGMLRIGTGGHASNWNDNMAKALVKYIGEGKLPIQEALSPSDIKKATEAIKKYVKKLGRRADGEVTVVANNIAKILRWDDTKRKHLTSYLYKLNRGTDKIIFGAGYNPALNEAPMDNRFQKEWERNSKVLMTHIKHEQSKNNRANTRELGKLYNMVQEASSVPQKLSRLVGMDEGKSPKRKTRLTEAFASKKLGAIFGKVSKWSASKNFLASMARSYGLEWDKITDAQVKGPDKTLDRKGIDVIIASKDTEIRESGRWSYTTRIGKGQLLGATIKGKRVWVGRGQRISTGGGSDRQFVGLDKRGFANVRSILGIDGAVVYHIDPELKSRGAGEKIASRKEAKEGATALMDARGAKEKNRERYEAVLKIRAGAEGKGALIKMIETATKMFEKVLKEKLDYLKKGMVSTDNWNHDAWRTVSRAHGDMIREFGYWMRQAADKEAQIKKDPEDTQRAIPYLDKQMNTYALQIKKDFNKMNADLKRIDKSKEYYKVAGRAY